MSDLQKKSNLGLILICGGVFILCVTIFGNYISKNPNFIADMKSRSDRARKVAFLQENKPVAPSSCEGIAPDIAERICTLSTQDPAPKWTSNLTAEEAICFNDGHTALRQYLIDYRSHPEESMSDYADNLSMIWFACEAFDDLGSPLPDSADAYAFMSQWFSARREYMLAVY